MTSCARTFSTKSNTLKKNRARPKSSKPTRSSETPKPTSSSPSQTTSVTNWCTTRESLTPLLSKPIPTDIKPDAKPLPSAFGQHPARPVEARRKRLASHMEKCHLRGCHSHDPKNVRLAVDVQRQAKHAQTASCPETPRSTHHCSSRSILPAILHPL